MDYLERFRVQPGSQVRLKDIDSAFTDGHESRQDAAGEIERYCKRLRELQDVLYAERRRSLLICLQALDTGGKDGTINHVLGAMNPQGCRAVAFRQPSAEEASHDFLWRVQRATPARGEVVIFNRSHYEDVLIARVHNLVPQAIWSKRYRQIDDFERMLTENGVYIVKFLLYISKEEQARRFRARLEDKTKNWKFSESDLRERQYWDRYIDAFNDAVRKCNAPHAPWYVIPANRKWFRNFAVAEILIHTLESMKPKLPKAPDGLSHIEFE